MSPTTIGLILTGLAAAVALLTWLGIGPFSRSDPAQTPSMQVTSIGQTGGITAGEVHFAPGPRELDLEKRKELLKRLPPPGTKPIKVQTSPGSPESMRLARHIYDFLKSEGFEVTGISTLLSSDERPGVMITDHGTYIEVWVRPELGFGL